MHWQRSSNSRGLFYLELSTNLVLEALEKAETAKMFTEKLLLLLNREDDPAQLLGDRYLQSTYFFIYLSSIYVSSNLYLCIFFLTLYLICIFCFPMYAFLYIYISIYPLSSFHFSYLCSIFLFIFISIIYL